MGATEIEVQFYGSCRRADPTPAPAAPAAAAPSAAPVVVTSTQAASLLVGSGTLHRQPESAVTRVDMPLVVYTDPAPQTLSTTVAGTPVDVEATPVAWRWDWGDGTVTQTSDPGRPWPDQSVTHSYARPAKGLHLTLTTTWRATYTPQGGDTLPVEGAVTTTQASTPFDVASVVAYLTDDAEHAQGH